MTDNAVYILGTLYQFKIGNDTQYPQLDGCDGITDTTTKLIVVNDFDDSKNDPNRKGDIELYQKQVARHEVLHAFLFESGLDANTFSFNAWAVNEEIVDWFAIQYPKIKKIYSELGVE